MVPSLIMPSSRSATEIFLLGLLSAVMLCFLWGKRSAQIANKIAQIFGLVLVPHLIEVITPLLIGHDHEPQHFFSGYCYRVLRLFWFASIFTVNVCEIPLSGCKKAFPKCFVIEGQGDRPPWLKHRGIRAG